MKYIAGGIVVAALVVGLILWLRGAPRSRDLEPATLPPAIAGPTESAPTTTQIQNPETSPTTTSNTTTTKNGMNIQTIKEGSGEPIKNGQVAVMEYTGTLADGSVFDSTDKHGGQPFKFTLGAGQVIAGWDQGILGMKVGEERTLTIPPELGYGANGYPPVIPENATLTFTVKLVGIE